MKNEKNYQDFLKAKELTKQKNIDQAYTKLKKLRKKVPDDLIVRYEFAKILIEMNNLDRAKKVLGSLLSTSNNKIAIFELGKLDVIDGNYKQARKKFESLLNTSKSNGGLLELGKLEALEENYDKADSLLKKVLCESNTETKIYAIHELLNLNIKLKKYEVALNYLYKLINLKNIIKLEDFYDIREIEKYEFYLKYKLNKINNFTNINGYYNNQLVKYDKNLAINYINYNNKINNKINNIINNNIDIKELFNIMEEKIKYLKPVNFGIYDKYTIDYENFIGKVNNIDANILCVVTLPDTKNIISMYPVLNKNKLNNKQLNDSKNLILRK